MYTYHYCLRFLHTCSSRSRNKHNFRSNLHPPQRPVEHQIRLESPVCFEGTGREEHRPWFPKYHPRRTRKSSADQALRLRCLHRLATLLIIRDRQRSCDKAGLCKSNIRRKRGLSVPQWICSVRLSSAARTKIRVGVDYERRAPSARRHRHQHSSF